MQEDFKIIAHRGFSAKAPENTIAAFDLAVHSGFPCIELDVQLTADRVPVIIHDDQLDRTTSGTGLVAETAYSAISILDAGSWFDSSFAGERVPTLSEVLNRFQKSAYLQIELKTQQEELAEVVYEELEKAGWLENKAAETFRAGSFSLTSFHSEQLRRSKKLFLSHVPHEWLISSVNNSILQAAQDDGFSGISLQVSAITVDIVREARARELTVKAWRIKTEEDLLKVVRAGVQAATVNWPDVARDVLFNEGLPNH